MASEPGVWICGTFYPPDTTVLYISCNGLDDVPTEIFQLRALRELSLVHNRLRSIPPAIGNLCELRRLWLYSNELTSVAAEIGKLKKLEHLDLSDNRLREIPCELVDAPMLKNVSLRGNPLRVLPDGICAHPSLTKLTFDSDDLVSIPSEVVIARCDSLVMNKMHYLDPNEALGPARERIRRDVSAVCDALRAVRKLPVHNYLPADVCDLVGQFVGRA
jgi:hypothetical protein